MTMNNNIKLGTDSVLTDKSRFFSCIIQPKSFSKELSFYHKLRFLNSYNLATRFSRPLIFQTINYGRSNSQSLKYQRFTPSGCKDIGIRKCKFVAKTQFLWEKIEMKNI